MFVSFEGIEGVGKTTQLKLMAETLKKAGVDVIVTREPGGTVMGEEIRNVLLAHRYESVSPMTELLLMFAARVQHVDTVILPALKKGKWVLCDRFTDATYAYQGGGRGVSLDLIHSLEMLTLKDFKPQLTLLLDAPVEVGLQRVQGRSSHPDRFELEKIDFFERVRQQYQQRAAAEPERFTIIDATQPLHIVQKMIISLIEHIIALQV